MNVRLGVMNMTNEPLADCHLTSGQDGHEVKEWPLVGTQYARIRFRLIEETSPRNHFRIEQSQPQESLTGDVEGWPCHRVGEQTDWTAAQEEAGRQLEAGHE